MEKEQIRLNLGCGPDIKEGYINIDMNDNLGVDMIGRIEELHLPPFDFKQNTVDEIYMKESLEHVGHRETVRVLKHCHSIMKTGANIYIKVPDMEECAKVIISGERIDEIMLRIYGGQQYPGNIHKSGYTKSSLMDLMSRIEFYITRMETVGWNIEMEAIK